MTRCVPSHLTPSSTPPPPLLHRGEGEDDKRKAFLGVGGGGWHDAVSDVAYPACLYHC